MPILLTFLMLSTCPGNQGVPPGAIWPDSVSMDISKQTHRVFFTPDLHDLILLKKSDDASPRLVPVKVSLNNGVKPVVRVAVSFDQGTFRYQYKVRNAAGARDFMIAFYVMAPAFLLGTNASYKPAGLSNPFWHASVNSATNIKNRELGTGVFGRSILWVSDWDEDHAGSELHKISPGREMDGFNVESPYLPGFTSGNASGLSWAPEESLIDDPDIDRELRMLRVDEYFDVSVLTFGPMFGPGSTGADVLHNYRAGVERLRGCVGNEADDPFFDDILKTLQGTDDVLVIRRRLKEITAHPVSSIANELMTCLSFALSHIESLQKQEKP